MFYVYLQFNKEVKGNKTIFEYTKTDKAFATKNEATEYARGIDGVVSNKNQPFLTRINETVYQVVYTGYARANVVKEFKSYDPAYNLARQRNLSAKQGTYYSVISGERNTWK